MGHFEPLIPLSSLYPACVDIIMADLVAIALRDFPPESRDLILAADEAAQTGLATNFPAADKQVLFLVKTVTVIVRRYFYLNLFSTKGHSSSPSSRSFTMLRRSPRSANALRLSPTSLININRCSGIRLR